MTDLSTVARDLIKSDPALAWEVHRIIEARGRPKVSMTPRQKEAFDFIKRYTEEQDGVAPSFEEIMNYCGLQSKSGVHRIVCALEERGLIRRLENRARAISIVVERAA